MSTLPRTPLSSLVHRENQAPRIAARCPDDAFQKRFSWSSGPRPSSQQRPKRGRRGPAPVLALVVGTGKHPAKKEKRLASPRPVLPSFTGTWMTWGARSRRSAGASASSCGPRLPRSRLGRRRRAGGGRSPPRGGPNRGPAALRLCARAWSRPPPPDCASTISFILSFRYQRPIKNYAEGRPSPRPEAAGPT